MPTIPTLLEMLKAGAHFGHRESKWHPKMEPYIFTSRAGVHIIDLEKTAAEIAKAMDFIGKITAQGGKVLFVGSKTQAQSIVKKYALEAGMPYVATRWLGGTLTNFGVINKLVERLKKMRREKEAGDWAKYTKKEQLKMSQELVKLEEMVGGLETLKKKPEALLLIDVKKEKTALREAIKTKLPVIALCDTNVDPTGIAYVIPANDDATKTIELITRLMAEAAIEGQAEQKTEVKEEKKKEEKLETTNNL